MAGNSIDEQAGAAYRSPEELLLGVQTFLCHGEVSTPDFAVGLGIRVASGQGHLPHLLAQGISVRSFCHAGVAKGRESHSARHAVLTHHSNVFR